MSAFTTLTITRQAALAKLAEVDINDLPEELSASLMYLGVVSKDPYPLAPRRIVARGWEDYNNGTLEDILDILFQDWLYNFIVQLSSWSMDTNDKVLSSLVIPSVTREKVYRLSHNDRRLYDLLQEKGFKAKDILALFATRKEVT